jgi:hypothetical protein
VKVVKYVPSFRGIKALRVSSEVDQMLERRARPVADAARAMYQALTLGMADVDVDVVQQGSDTRAPRARVAVIARSPWAIQMEAKHRVLGSALDAGRFTSVKKTPTRAGRRRAKLTSARKQIRARDRRR